MNRSENTRDGVEGLVERLDGFARNGLMDEVATTLKAQAAELERLHSLVAEKNRTLAPKTWGEWERGQ